MVTTVNPVFLLEVKQDHTELWRLLEEIRESLSLRTGAPKRERLSEAFVLCQDVLARHFSLEDTYGYFDDAISVAPWLARRATQLQAEHASLLAHVSGLVDDVMAIAATSSLETWHTIAQKFERFLDQFRRHEHAETALLFQAFYDDLGVGD